MSYTRSIQLLFCGLFSIFAAFAQAENEGQADLDKATQLKVTAESMEDLNEVIDHLDTSLEKGLDNDNTEIAQQLLVASLMQRGTLFGTALFNLPAQEAQRGLKAIQLRQFALSDLQRAVELDDKLWDAYLMIGKLQLQPLPVPDAGAAKRTWTRVIDAAEAPKESKAEALALRSALQHDEEKQLADLNRAIELEAEKPDYLRLRAQYYYGKEKFDDALADADHALKLEPDHPMTQELRGMILLGLEKYDEALECFNRASELAPGAALPYQSRGELYSQKGDLEKALEQLGKALEFAPDNVDALLLRAEVYYRLKKMDKAMEDAEHAIKARPDLVRPHLIQVEILAASDRLSEAITELDRLVKLAPDNTQLLTRLATFYLAANKPRKAIETLTPIIEKEASNFAALRLRADAYLSIGQHADAIADFDKAYALNQEDESLLNNLAWVLATSPEDNLRDGERALKLATKAADMSNHQTPHILSTLAAAYAETGDFENAKKWSAQSVELQQKALDAAEDEKERTKIETDLDQLKKELASYEESKPVRERQNTDESATDSTADKTAAPAPASPARSSNF